MKDSTEQRLAKIVGDYDRRMSEGQGEREQEKLFNTMYRYLLQGE